ncbi:Rv0909 family putative TA system antitoxin [Streptosporangium sp. NBC_01755]|uniref:antitoxin n=1 Tax=unclassified Streptosporangium TaxID=2632669 RepID=UPI002DDA80E4|nr:MULTISPECIES: Rv0909 family putative TA system antitoxin [unclassified Streptosporangium]WSA23427.1 Rv0909 family putative TA system antitoxin [Streptosporangium sp. NBC_01810]WSC98370.1 Rv0909 family putative TA system antitoxin [Streptosporangium sp. NBC_01755]
MSILDKVKNMLGGNAKTEEIVKKGIDKAEQIARKKTGGKHDQQISTAAQKAREMADKIDNQPDTGQPGTTPTPGRPDQQGRPDTPPPYGP